MSGAGEGSGDDSVGANKKPRLADGESENEHIVSMMQMVRGEHLSSCARS